MRKTFVFIAGATLSAAAFAASSAFAGQAAAPAGDVAKGKASFERTGCWQCHGRQGQGGREGPRIASPVPMAWPVLSKFVRTTNSRCPDTAGARGRLAGPVEICADHKGRHAAIYRERAVESG